jgi:hypothetical protein
MTSRPRTKHCDPPDGVGEIVIAIGMALSAERRLDRAEHSTISVWIFQKVDCAGLHRTHRRLNISLARHNNNRKVASDLVQLRLDWCAEPVQRQNGRRSVDRRRFWKELSSSTQASGRMRRIQMRRCFLRALWRHFYRRWLARNAPRPKQLLLDVIFGFAREAIIELARLTEYQHFMLLANQVQCQAHFSASGQGKAKDCSASGIRLVLELAAVGFGGRLSNRETEPYECYADAEQQWKRDDVCEIE